MYQKTAVLIKICIDIFLLFQITISCVESISFNFLLFRVLAFRFI